MSSKQFNRRRFIWLDQVMADRGLPASAFKVAYCLSQKFNEGEGGAAWPSVHTIAGVVGRSKSVVLDAVRLLGDHGHLEIEAGRQGRGHSNQYRMLIKGQQADLFDPPAKGRPAKIKGRISGRKGRPAELNLSKTLGPLKRPLESEGERNALTRDDSPGDGGRLKGAASQKGKEGSGLPTTKEESESAFAQLSAVYDRGHLDDPEPDRRAYDRAIARGATHDEIMAGARVHVAAAEAPKYLKALAVWLDREGYRKAPPAKRSRGTGPRRNGGKAPLAWLMHNQVDRGRS